jgi:hypothetical protein
VFCTTPKYSMYAIGYASFVLLLDALHFLFFICYSVYILFIEA